MNSEQDDPLEEVLDKLDSEQASEPGKQTKSRTLAALEPDRRQDVKTICVTCPNSV